jgi:hypothetical protein
MARRILLQEVERTTERVVHEATHDVESFQELQLVGLILS